MLLTRTISLTNFFVATTALGFQVGVLYPWHKQLDDDFEALKKEHLRVLESIRKSEAGNGGANNNNTAPETQKRKGLGEMISSLAGGWR
jgi:hypothetical protein